MYTVISIAGSDSGGGAGIQADLKTFEAHGVFGTTAITSITAQNTMGVRAVADLPLTMILAQLDAIFDDFEIAAVKIGMLSSREIIELVSGFLRERADGIPIVLDPVMVATSGDSLLNNDAVELIRRDLAPLATLITPNADEASILADMAITSMEEMQEAAMRIAGEKGNAVLIKGGHLTARLTEPGRSPKAIDLLFDGAGFSTFERAFIETMHTHGTGCTLSSAIAANLARGLNLVEAVRQGKEYVYGAIAAAPGLGHGHGPLLHRWRQGIE